MKKLFLVERTDDVDYDEFIALVVCAKDDKTALTILPESEYTYMTYSGRESVWLSYPRSVRYLGIADDSLELNSVIMDSFLAG